MKKKSIDLFDLTIFLFIIVIILFSIFNFQDKLLEKSPIKIGSTISQETTSTQATQSNLQTLEGNLEILTTDNFENKKGETFYYLTTDKNELIRLKPTSNINLNLNSGTRIRVSGKRVGNELTFDPTKTIEDQSTSGGMDIIQTTSVFRSPISRNVAPLPIEIPNEEPSGGGSLPAPPVLYYVTRATGTPSCSSSAMIVFTGSFDDSFTSKLLISRNPSFTNCNYADKSGCICATDDSLGMTSCTGTVPSGSLTYYAKACDSYNQCSNVITNTIACVGENTPNAINQKILVVLANYNDTIQPDLTTNQIRDLMFNQSNSVSAYYKENSYNKLNLSGDVVGYYQLPISSPSSCNPGTIRQKTVNAVYGLLNSTYNFSDYSVLIVIAPFNRNCGWAGITNAGSGITKLGQILILPSWARLHTIAHEYGHILINSHASFYDCGNISLDYQSYNPDCSTIEYGDLGDVMGGVDIHDQRYPGQFNAIHKKNMNWLSTCDTLGKCNILDLSNMSSGTNFTNITLEPIEIPSNNLKIIKIPRSSGSLYIEYRQPIGFDKFIPSNYYQGALIHLDISLMGIDSMLIDATPPGDQFTPVLPLNKVFTDPNTGTSFSVVSMNSTGLTINLSLGNTDFVTKPIVNITSPKTGDIVRGSLLVKVNASCSLGIQKVGFDYLASDRIDSGCEWSDSSSFGIKTLPPYEAIIDTRNLTDCSSGHLVSAVNYNLTIFATAVCNNYRSQRSEMVVVNVQNSCSDGTFLNQCSTNKPYYCNATGNLTNNCQLCGCSTGICQGDGTCKTTCSDGTHINTCSTNKPLYCKSTGILVNSCGICGCPSGLGCILDGSCQRNVPPTKPPIINPR